jgi:cellulose synthase (UDP-forming)
VTNAVGSRRRRPARRAQILPDGVDDTEKYVYAWRSLPYLGVILFVAFLSATASQVWFEVHDHIWLLCLYTLLAVVYYGCSAPFSFTGRSTDMRAHIRKVQAWYPRRYPDVDIYLPICGEPVDVLRNTWTGVFELVHAYPGVAVPIVLDDGDDPEAARLAASFGFTYWVRPNRGEHKKSGNMRFAFRYTRGEFFVVLDADFRPRHDLLAETLPYFDDPDLAIVQTPQYFRTHPEQTWVERAAGAIQEVFYRSIQVSRNRLGASICVGTCAVYRREPLEPHGGPTLIAYAEDVHTGLDVRRDGWSLIYVPIVLCVGMCPDSVDAFIRQQYRWCTGSTSTVLTRRLWTVPMSIPARLTYISGFCYYLFTALLIFVVPAISIGLLLFFSNNIEPSNYELLAPALIVGMLLYPLWHHSDYQLRSILPLSIARGWAHTLAISDYLRGRTMGWEPSGARVSPIRRYWLGVWIWNGGTAVLWLLLFAYRTIETGSARFLLLGIAGAINLAVVARAAMPGRG